MRLVLACVVLTVFASLASAFDQSAFDATLKRFVDDRGRVDYAGLRGDSSSLDSYINQLSEVDLNSLDENDRLATLINAYNAFTLKLIAENAGINSIKDIPVEKRWKAERWNLGGRILSLDFIEHDIIRKEFAEPRIHFALVCAGWGCPPLRNEAYVGERLDAQLDDQMRRTHRNGTRWFNYDADRNVLELTALYDWFAGDFEKKSGTVLNFVAQYSSELKSNLAAGQTPTVKFMDYDWSLNDRRH